MDAVGAALDDHRLARYGLEDVERSLGEDPGTDAVRVHDTFTVGVHEQTPQTADPVRYG